jgi:hypothetical protein
MMHFFRPVLWSALIVCAANTCVLADGMVVQHGAALTIDGGSLYMHCQPLTVTDGGLLHLQAGRIDAVVLTIEPGGSFDHVGGIVDDGDVDGADLVEFANAFQVADLPAFASEYGQDRCP